MLTIQATATGKNGILEIYPHKVVIKRNNRLLYNYGEKEIYYKGLNGIKLVKPSFFNTGYIQLQISGSDQTKGQGIDLVKDENTLFISKSNYPQFEHVKKLIEENIYLSNK